MPRWVLVVLLILGSLAFIPFACVARSRALKSEQPRFHLVSDMDNQGRFKSQQANVIFRDRRAMRPPVAGTVARGGLAEDEAFHRGLDGEAYVEGFPMPLTEQVLFRGQERFNVYCAPCHGLSGRGDGIVARRADRLEQGTWVPPTSLHDETASSRPEGHIFNTITNGIRSMPAYGSQIPVEDRWAIVSYVRALQRSQKAGLEDVPSELRQSLR